MRSVVRLAAEHYYWVLCCGRRRSMARLRSKTGCWSSTIPVPSNRSRLPDTMRQRHIPERNRCRIAVDSVDYITQGEFESRIKAPLRECLEGSREAEDPLHC